MPVYEMKKARFFFRLIFSSVSFHFARFRYVALFIAIIHVQNKYQVKDNKKIKNEKKRRKKRMENLTFTRY